MALLHSVHLMNVEQRQAAADLQTKSADLGCEFITVSIGCYYPHPPSPSSVTQRES